MTLATSLGIPSDTTISGAVHQTYLAASRSISELRTISFIASSPLCPEVYGPHTTIYNRFARWARRGIWKNLFRELAGGGWSAETQMIDSTHVKAHRSAAGGKGGSRNRLLAARVEGAIRRSMHSQMLRGA